MKKVDFCAIVIKETSVQMDRLRSIPTIKNTPSYGRFMKGSVQLRTDVKKKRHIGLYVAGSLAVAAGMAVVMPRILDLLSEKFYEAPVPEHYDDDDLGPEIVRCTPEDEEAKGNDNGEL